MSEIDTVLGLLTGLEFLTGLLAGLLASLWFLVARASTPSAGWALAIAGAMTLGIHVAVGRRLGLAAGLLILAVGGFLLERAERVRDGSNSRLLAWSLLAGGAVVVTARGGVPQIPWVLIGTPILIVLFGSQLRAWRLRSDLWSLGGAFLLVTSVGIWATLPDTNTARIMLGIAIPMSWTTTRSIGARISSAGAFPLAALVVWLGATGGAERPASIIGGWACIGVLALYPSLSDRMPRAPIATLAFHSLWVLISARVFGLWETGLSALIGVLAMGALALSAVRLFHSARSSTSVADASS